MERDDLEHYKHFVNLYYSFEDNVFVKYWPDEYNIQEWWDLYKEYQVYDKRVVQVLDINFKKGYFVMEAIKGKVLEQEMILLNFDQKKKILLETMDTFNNFFKFKCDVLNKHDIFFHTDFTTHNLIFTEDEELKLVDVNSFRSIPLGRMNNMLFFGKYMDVLSSIKDRLSFTELTDLQIVNLGKGYLY